MKTLKKFWDAPGAAFNALARGIGAMRVVAWIDDAAKGQRGLGAWKVYWALAGWKTITSALLGLGAMVASAMGADESARWITYAAGIGVSAALIDKGYRAPSRPEALENSGIYRLIAQFAPQITTAFAGAWLWVASSECTTVSLGQLDISCSVMSAAMPVLAVVAAWLGLLDAAFLARSPIPPAAKRVFREWRGV